MGLLRRYLNKIPIGRPQSRLPTRRSRFLEAKFKESHDVGPSGEGRRHELSYRLYLPSGSSRRDSLPLIVMLHGCKQDSVSFAEGTLVNTRAEEHRCAMLYPEQSSRWAES
jgi:poly(3-hydroxybutyrate) depolymerase